MPDHFDDAVADAHACPCIVHDATTNQLVGFVMISDDIPAETLAACDDTVGPYDLWWLLIDERFQGRGYGRATIDAIVDYLRPMRNAETLLTRCQDGPGSLHRSTSTTASPNRHHRQRIRTPEAPTGRQVRRGVAYPEGVATEVGRHWTIEELFHDVAPPTDDDVSIALDGRRLDTPEKVIAYLDEINRDRVAAERGS